MDEGSSGAAMKPDRPNISVRYHSLDIYRGIAALWVFTFHIADTIEQSVGFLAPAARLGYLGVPMFFIISGYCLASSLSRSVRKGESARRFVMRRLRRIYPTFWCSAVVAVSIPYLIEAISAAKTGRYTAPEVGFNGYGLVDWLRLATLTSSLFADGPDLQSAFSPVNAVYWTLAIELQFYLVVAAALAARHWVRPAGLLGIVTVTSIAFAASPAAYRTGLFLPFWPMFALGLGLFATLNAGFTPAALLGRHTLAISGGLAPLIATCYFAAIGGGWLAPTHLAFAAVTAVLFWFCHALDEPLDRLNRSRWRLARGLMRALLLSGAMSYSIYLLHGKLCWLVIQFIRQGFGPESPAFAAATVLGTLALCYPFYWFFEKPFVGSGFSRVSDPHDAIPAPAHSPRRHRVDGLPVDVR